MRRVPHVSRCLGGNLKSLKASDEFSVQSSRFNVQRCAFGAVQGFTFKVQSWEVGTLNFEPANGSRRLRIVGESEVVIQVSEAGDDAQTIRGYGSRDRWKRCRSLDSAYGFIVEQIGAG